MRLSRFVNGSQAGTEQLALPPGWAGSHDDRETGGRGAERSHSREHTKGAGHVRGKVHKAAGPLSANDIRSPPTSACHRFRARQSSCLGICLHGDAAELTLTQEDIGDVNAGRILTPWYRREAVRRGREAIIKVPQKFPTGNL